MSTLVCRDCGWAARCPSCDLMMRVHLHPENCLLCHFCEAKGIIPDRCPKCSSYHLVQSGARVQAIDVSVRELLPQARILLIEDLNIAGMIRNRSLARRIAGASWGEVSCCGACSGVCSGSGVVVTGCPPFSCFQIGGHSYEADVWLLCECCANSCCSSASCSRYRCTLRSFTSS